MYSSFFSPLELCLSIGTPKTASAMINITLYKEHMQIGKKHHESDDEKGKRHEKIFAKKDIQLKRKCKIKYGLHLLTMKVLKSPGILEALRMKS